MTKGSESPGFGGVPLPGLRDDEVFGFDEARKRFGDSFDPIPVPVLPPADPNLDRAVAELRRLRDATATLAHSEVELGDIADKLAEVADSGRVLGLEIVQKVESNVVFAAMPAEVAARARQKFAFANWPLEKDIVRLMCAFDTTTEDIDALVAAIAGD